MSKGHKPTQASLLSLPVELQRECIKWLWDPTDDCGVWAGYQRRIAFRLACKAFKEHLDTEDERFAVITSTPQIERLLEQSAERLARMERLCISFVAVDVTDEDFDIAGEDPQLLAQVAAREARLAEMAQRAATLLCAIPVRLFDSVPLASCIQSGRRRFATWPFASSRWTWLIRAPTCIKVAFHTLQQAEYVQQCVTNALCQLTALRSFAYLPDSLSGAPARLGQGCFQSLLKSRRLSRLDCESIHLDNVEAGPAVRLPTSLVACHIGNVSPWQSKPLVVDTSNVVAVTNTAGYDELTGNYRGFLGDDRLGNLSTLCVDSDQGEWFKRLPPLPKLRHLTVIDSLRADVWWVRDFCGQDLDVLEFRHYCRQHTSDPSPHESFQSHYAGEVLDELSCEYLNKSPNIHEFCWRCARGCNVVPAESLQHTREFLATRGVSLHRTWGYDLGWANV